MTLAEHIEHRLSRWATEVYGLDAVVYDVETLAGKRGLSFSLDVA